MTNPPVPRFPPQPISWSDVARLCRRICLLRECGQNDAAEILRRTSLEDALNSLRTSEDPATIAQRLESTFAAEAERVANAAVLAEMLAPLLNKQRHSLDPFGAAAAEAPPMATSTPADSPALATAVAPRSSAPRGAPADIAHFIDEMIAQESAAPARPTRRAS